MNTNHHKPREILNLLRLLCKLSARQEKGTALVTAMGFGLLLVLLGTVAIIRSGNDNFNASVNEATEQNLAITNAGIENLIAELNKPSARPLLVLNQDPSGLLGCADDPATTTLNECNEWADTSGQVTLEYTNATNSCGGGNTSEVAETNISSFNVNMINSGSGDPVSVGTGSSGGEYKLMAYVFEDPDGDPLTSDNQFGRLLVQGNLGTGTSDKTKSASRIEVRFPVSINQSSSGGAGAAALMAEEMEFGNVSGGTGANGLEGNAICTDPSNCPLSCDADATEPTDAQLRNAIGASRTDAVNGDITIGGSVIPDVPDVPLAVITNNRLYTITGGGVTLPRSGEVAQDGIYYYKTGSSVNFTTAIKVKGNNEVRIYHDGTIDYAGNDFITAVDSSNTNTKILPGVGQIRLYGASVNTTTGEAVLPPNPTYWELSGNSCLHVVLHAPNTYIGYNGGGGGNACDDSPGLAADANFYGVVWVKGFGLYPNGSTRNNALTIEIVEQPGLITLLEGEFGSNAFNVDSVSISSVSEWQRKGL